MSVLTLCVPSACVDSNTPEENQYALDQMQKVLKADTRSSAELSFAALRNLSRGDSEETSHR